MAIDLSLTAVPIQVKNILSKSVEKKDSEYADALFTLPSAFQSDFIDFGHPDWIAFRKDAISLVKYYPKKKFEDKYHFDTNRIYGALNYLIAQYENKKESSFFNDGIPVDELRSGQGFLLKYWDREMIKKKKELIESIKYEDLIRHYDFEKMYMDGVYKVTQIDKDSIKTIFQGLKDFIINAAILNGFVIVSKY
ncbi:DUF1877 family protein [Dokdonia sp.]|uniref:DUF1877 family protein n=1 Tax=Dokdonia sp. TaxID=2024995 RepID=UPI0032633145